MPAEAARSLGVSAVAARMRLSRARRKLRSQIADDFPRQRALATDLDVDRQPRGVR
jgi:DNA-directed RNA polymerase specialized sigma24 family protein